MKVHLYLYERFKPQFSNTTMENICLHVLLPYIQKIEVQLKCNTSNHNCHMTMNSNYAAMKCIWSDRVCLHTFGGHCIDDSVMYVYNMLNSSE